MKPQNSDFLNKQEIMQKFNLSQEDIAGFDGDTLNTMRNSIKENMFVNRLNIPEGKNKNPIKAYNYSIESIDELINKNNERLSSITITPIQKITANMQNYYLEAAKEQLEFKKQVFNDANVDMKHFNAVGAGELSDWVAQAKQDMQQENQPKDLKDLQARAKNQLATNNSIYNDPSKNAQEKNSASRLIIKAAIYLKLASSKLQSLVAMVRQQPAAANSYQAAHTQMQTSNKNNVVESDAQAAARLLSEAKQTYEAHHEARKMEEYYDGTSLKGGNRSQSETLKERAAELAEKAYHLGSAEAGEFLQKVDSVRYGFARQEMAENNQTPPDDIKVAATRETRSNSNSNVVSEPKQEAVKENTSSSSQASNSNDDASTEASYQASFRGGPK